ncbi:hypothetical protein DO97_03475 [Neosynechococcus sphagnicola sy1]|uniref:Uncharacterized protein n=1 Tax=Neosynechococcus sphagnicola sy1 TaxID=1497020 RepID=A0A098TLR4_9CYAN|nr:hypothetical protein DO97_03475 [Neosynechococcus sphagnicola sy1]
MNGNLSPQASSTDQRLEKVTGALEKLVSPSKPGFGGGVTINQNNDNKVTVNAAPGDTNGTQAMTNSTLQVLDDIMKKAKVAAQAAF